MVIGLSMAPLVHAQEAWVVTSFEVDFEISNAGLPVRGSFDALDAEVSFDPDDLDASRIEGRIDPTSIRTGIALRDRHLAGRQFFDARRFPSMFMRSSTLEPAQDGYVGTFDLTIRDVTRPVEVTFRFERSAIGATISGSLTIDRVDFGVGDAGFLLGEEVTVTVLVELEPADLEPPVIDRM